MAKAAVSVLGVGFAGAGLAVRHWLSALGIVAGPLVCTLMLLVMVRGSSGGMRGAANLELVAIYLAMLVLTCGVGQLLAYRVILTGRPRSRLGDAGWMVDLGRILVVTVLWIFVAAVLQVLLAMGWQTVGLGEPWIFVNWIIGVPLLAAPITLMGLAGAAGYEQRRWVLFRAPPPWRDLSRISLGYLLAIGQLVGFWWITGRVLVWLTRPEAMAGFSSAERLLFRVVVLGLALGLTLLVITPTLAQAWRQSLGRPAQDPAAVFD